MSSLSNPPSGLPTRATTAYRIGPFQPASNLYSAAAAASALRLRGPTASAGVPKASVVLVLTSTITSSPSRRRDRGLTDCDGRIMRRSRQAPRRGAGQGAEAKEGVALGGAHRRCAT